MEVKPTNKLIFTPLLISVNLVTSCFIHFSTKGQDFILLLLLLGSKCALDLRKPGGSKNSTWGLIMQGRKSTNWEYNSNMISSS